MPKVGERIKEKRYTGLGGELPQEDVQPSKVPAQVEKIASGIYQKQVERVNKIAILEADTDISDNDSFLLNDPDNGALNKFGKDAMAGYEDVMEARQRHVDAILNGLSNDTQRDAVRARAASTGGAFDSKLQVHQSKQTLLHENSVYKSALDSRMKAVENSYDNENEWAHIIDETHMLIAENAATNGRDHTWVDNARKDVTSNIHKKIIQQYTLEGDHAAAREHYDKHEAEIYDDANLKEKVYGNSNNGIGVDAAQEAWDANQPADPIEDLDVPAMNAMVRDLIDKGENPEAYSVAMSDIRERVALRNLARKQAITDRDSALDAMFTDGMSFAEVMITPEYLSMNGTERRAFKKTWDADKRIQAGEKIGKYTDAQFEAYSKVNETDNLLEMTMDEVSALWPHLGGTLTQRLKQKRETLAKFDPSQVKMLDKDWKIIANRAGLRPFKKGLTEEEKSGISELYDATIRILSEAQQAKGKKLTGEEMRNIMTEEIGSKVVLNTNWWPAADPEKAIFALTPEDLATVKVPAQDEASIRRVLLANGTEPTWENIVALYLRNKRGK